MDKPIRVLVVGCGHMGTSHALAYHQSAEFEIVGLVSRGESSRARLAESLGGYPTFNNFSNALTETNPDAVCVCTYPDTHARYASEALEAGCHVFLEKPLGVTVKEAEDLVALSVKVDRKLLVGYILQYHPAWMRFVEESQNLGKPLVMRMNLNQQSSGSEWESHKNIMQSMSPMVDCGVHYVDVMCRMTNAKPVRVHGITARCSEELPKGMYNYGQLQVGFDDGSVGWYEAGWGPMISKVAFFVKDVIGPNGCVSIVADTSTLKDSADVNAHTKTDSLLVHNASLDKTGQFSHSDTIIATADEPDHDSLCALEQAFFARAIGENLDLTAHLDSAVLSLKVVLAAEESAKSGQVVNL
jgi:predicted dehydrogenase